LASCHLRGEAVVVLASVAMMAGCRTTPEAPPPPGPVPPVSSPSHLCRDPGLENDDFCLPVERVEALMRSGRDRIVEARVTQSGFSRPRRLRISIAGEDDGDPLVFKLKWKPAPSGGAGFNNVPSREIAAYAAQRLFLDPDEYVVPPTIARCVEVETHAQFVGREGATLKGTRCVFGLVAYWLENVTPDGALDLERFETDPAYRHNLANLNMLTYLIDQRDSRKANFLVSTDPDRPRVFVIDNGLAFGGFKNPFTYGPFMKDWGKLQVSRLPSASVDRLRKLTRTELDGLLVVAQFENRNGLLVEVSPGEPLDDEKEFRFQRGVAQLGLNREQIDAMEERIRELLERVDAGEIQLF
jgi:hypothetical protein